MATLKTESGLNGRVWVTLTRFGAEDLARLKKIPGHRWNPERKQWSFPDTEETRAALAKIVESPSAPSLQMHAGGEAERSKCGYRAEKKIRSCGSSGETTTEMPGE